MHYWLRYWGRVAARAWRDAWGSVEPHKELYAVVTGAICGYVVAALFGNDADPLKVAVLGLSGAVAGIALALALTYTVQFVAAPARLDRERAAEVDRLRWTRGETYAMIAAMLEDINGLKMFPQNHTPAMRERWEAQHGAIMERLWDELRPRLRDHEFWGIVQAPPADEMPPVSDQFGAKYLSLTPLSRRLIEVMKKYETDGGADRR